MNNALLYLGGILVTALAVLFAVPRFVDWNTYRGIFEEEASRILGREVRVGGAVNVRLLPAPYVSFERLRIADIGDDGGNSIIRVESFTMWLSVPPLLRGVLEANRVELRRPIINLATNNSGSGNWRSLAITPGAFRFAPKDVALQSVKINDGAIIVSGPTRTELARFDGINGEFTAEALEGPFKFKGEVAWDGAPRHLRLSTAKIDPNGDLRFKAAVDVVGSSNSYVLDARLSDIKNTPKLDGDLTAKLVLGPARKRAPATDAAASPPPAPAPSAGEVPALPKSDASQTEAAIPAHAPEAAPAATEPPDGFELKAKVAGTTLGVELRDIAVSLEAGATPQLITGQAKFGWADKMRLDVELASRWLDLDRIAHTTGAKIPLEAGRGYFEALASVLPSEADTNARLDFDQLTLGGEPIGNVHLAASRSGGPLEIKGVRANLPGGARLELDGILTPTGKVPRLDGSLFISGRSLTRFLAWGLGDAAFGRGRNDGSFSLDGKFALGDDTLALTDAAAEFAGTPLAGEVRFDLGERRKLAIAIEGPRVDVAQFGSGLVSLSVLQDALFGGVSASTEGESSPPTPKTAFFDPATSDLSLDLKVAEMVDGNRVLTNVDTYIRLERGTLSIPRLKFSTPEGLSVEADGEAKDVPARPNGTIQGLISAPTEQAVRSFLALIHGDGEPDADLQRLTRLAPLRLAGALQLSGGAANASALSLDGTMQGGRISASVRLDGGRSQWRSAPLDVQASVESPDIAKLVSTLFDARIKADASEAPKGGRAAIKATGTPTNGLLSLADVNADGLALSYRGRVSLPEAGKTQLDGALKVAVSDVRVGLALAGLSASDGVADIPLGGTINVRRDGASLKLDSEVLKLGDSRVSGQVALTTEDGGRQTIDAVLNADKASFASLLAPILGRPDARAGDAALSPSAPQQATRVPGGVSQQPGTDSEPAPATAMIWPEQTFDLSLLERIEGKVALNVGALVLEPGLTVGNARLMSEFTPTAIKITSLEGDAAGGRLTSQLDLAKAPAGIALTGALRIDISNNPVAVEAGNAPPPGDAVAFNVSFSSRALSPAAVLSALTGKGELTVGNATLNGNSPAAVSTVARAALTGQGPSGGNALVEALKGSLKQGEVNLGKVTIPVEISDGALKLEKVRVEMGEGRSTFVTAVELATMKIDSEWQIEPKLDKSLSVTSSRAFLPPVTVVYTGKLSELASLVPQVSASALERELVVRKMEIDVGELERLRKQDEARAREDAERRKALEDDAPPPQPAPPPPPPGATQDGTDALPQGGSSQMLDDGLPSLDAVTPPGTEALAPEVVPSPAAQRPPPRKKRPPDENWRPFQTPY
jgi:uncharacterized protein involved in outer membrane biogenesis